MPAQEATGVAAKALRTFDKRFSASNESRAGSQLSTKD
jgi:hypothetical protein